MKYSGGVTLSFDSILIFKEFVLKLLFLKDFSVANTLSKRHGINKILKCTQFKHDKVDLNIK